VSSKLVGKAGVLKADKKMVVRTMSIIGAAKDAPPSAAIIYFTETDAGKATQVSVTVTNVPDAKADAVKSVGKILAMDIAAFLAPKPVAKKAVAKKPAAKKPAAKKPAAKNAVAKKPAAKKPAAKKPAAKKAVAKKAVAKKPAAKKPATKKTSSSAPTLVIKK
ncbi:MAG TPA: histone H1-like repetitive region-containing protein, partial [Treponemataceae bacterium]|nr:histone H1-like repetitive region-containing protein [Treponemataceae bacterium]